MNKHPFLPAPTAVALFFGLLCLSALSSCTGCSYNHEKAMGSIDNILGKVDTLMKKTDRFLEEHLPEEPPHVYRGLLPALRQRGERGRGERSIRQPAGTPH